MKVKVDDMTQLMKTTIRKIDWFFIGIAASLWGAKMWAPLGLIFSVPTVVLAVKSRELHPRRVVGSAILVMVMLLMTSSYISERYSYKAWDTTETKRVQRAFQMMSTIVAKREGVTSLELTPVRAGVASYPDGTTASLWVTSPTPVGIRSHCFYVDMPRVGGASGNSSSGCVDFGIGLSLDRQGSVVVGNIGSSWPARSVLVSTNGASVKLPVTLGFSFFLAQYQLILLQSSR